MKNIRPDLIDLLGSEEKPALATVVRSTGSTPQKEGHSALFGVKGLLTGTVGGGILEGEVTQLSVNALKTGTSGLFSFDLDHSQGEEGAICGGKVEVLIDARPGRWIPVLKRAERSLANRKEGLLLTLTQTSDKEGLAIERFWIENSHPLSRPDGIPESIWNWLEAQLPAGQFPDFINHPENDPATRPFSIIAEKISPRSQLLIAGAGHVGKALAHLARLLEFEVVVIDDRKEYACQEHIPDADQFIVQEIGKAMEKVEKGPDTYIVIATRGHGQDADALRACVDSGAAYVGMIGSRHKVATLKKDFLAKGWATPEQWGRIHAPVGIDIGSKTVQEIALSIAAQLVMRRNKPNTGHAS